MPRLAALAALGAAAAAATWVVLDPSNSGLPLLLAALGLLVAGAAWLETGPDAAKEIVLVATLAAVLAPEPDLLVLDEPTRGVDPERKAELARRLRAEATKRATLVVTHDRAFATAVADRVVSLGPTREATHV